MKKTTSIIFGLILLASMQVWAFPPTPPTPPSSGTTDLTAITTSVNTAYATVASHATTSAIWAAAGNIINFTGGETITALPAASQAGSQRILICAGTPTFTHAGALTVQGGASYTAAAGDLILVTATTTTAFKITVFKQSGLPTATGTMTNAKYCIFTTTTGIVCNSEGGAGYTNLTSFVDQTAWRVFYSDGSGDVKELTLGADGTYLKSNGASSAPSFATPAGDITAAGNNTFTGANTIGDGGDLQKVQHMIPTADNTWSGEAMLVTSAAALAIGDVVYINGDGKAAKAIATADTTMPAICVMVETASAGDESKFCMTRGMLKYPAAHTDFTVTGGSANTLKVSEDTAGVPTTHQPHASASIVQWIGVALAADLALFNFNLITVQVP